MNSQLLSLSSLRDRLIQLTDEVNTFKSMPVGDVSRSRLATISTELRELSKHITKQPIEPDTKLQLTEVQEIFKLLIVGVRDMLLQIQKNRRSSTYQSTFSPFQILARVRHPR
eukprot:TRINITY_DN3308_c0_g1_i24.p1 TRINITY_DN3308_c0_g1~~TRINITY_DN3308_c0_g1_i24.p1  ORF type:complete len:113 (+),score=18.07 TRINITY_DN3308_c0_g1_i24:70-408(+)